MTNTSSSNERQQQQDASAESDPSKSGSSGGGVGWAILSAINAVTTNSFTQVTQEKMVEESTTGSRADDDKIDVNLQNVPETMLWTLHNRAGEILKGHWSQDYDPMCLEIYQAIQYDYERSFGPSEESHGLRSELFDCRIRQFWQGQKKGSVIINLGEGLETQRYRLEADRQENESLWVTVDLPSAMAAREKFIQPDAHHVHIAASAVDVEEWASKLPVSYRSKPTFLTAQGLVMYLSPEDNAKMFAALAQHFPGATFVFDFLAAFVSDMSLKGWKKTPHYQVPPMPTGANRFDCPALFERWVPGCTVEYVYWPTEKSHSFFTKYIVPIMIHTPILRDYQPGMVWAVTFPDAPKT